MYIDLITIDLCPGQGGGVRPSGTIELSRNGEYDVTSYASALVTAAKREESVVVLPSTVAYSITPDERYVFNRVDVSAVTAAIDSNIQAENIKSGVEILGVSGNYGTDYRERTGTISGLSTIGWDSDSISYANANVLHYTAENEIYAVSSTEVSAYGVITASNITEYSGSGLKYTPMFYTSEVSNFDNYFDGFSKLKTIPIYDTSAGTTMRYMFQNCSDLVTVPPFDTSECTNMNYMFKNCSKLESVPLFNTSNVIGVGEMFLGCSRLTSIPQFDLSSCVNTTGMFRGCGSLNVVPVLNTSSVISMNYMFYDCFLDHPGYIYGIDFSGLSSAPTDFFTVLQSGYLTLNKFIVNGILNFSWDLSKVRLTDTDSIVSILQAMNRTTDTVNTKNMVFWEQGITIEDPTGDIDTLYTSCQNKNWNISNLTINTPGPGPEPSQYYIEYESSDGLAIVPGITTASAWGGATYLDSIYYNGYGRMYFDSMPTKFPNTGFRNLNLSAIAIPSSVTELAGNAFFNTPMREVTIPATVTTIGGTLFGGQGGMATGPGKVYIQNTNAPSTYHTNVFGGCAQVVTVYVPQGTLQSYKALWTNVPHMYEVQ